MKSSGADVLSSRKKKTHKKPQKWRGGGTKKMSLLKRSTASTASTVSGLPFVQNIVIILNCLDAEK